MMIVDVMVALSIGVLFLTLIIETSLSSRITFERARERSGLLDIYEAHAVESENLLPRQSHDAYGIHANARLYGNERIETDSTITSSSSNQSISFISIKNNPTVHSISSAGTSLCSVDLFKSSLSITPITLPINSTIPLTHLEVRNGIAYASADSSKASDPDIFIFDIRDPAQPKLISSLNTGPGISSFILIGNHIVTADSSTAHQMQSIRLDSLTTPILEMSYKLPLPYATATPPFADSIFGRGNIVYIGTEKWVGPEFSAVDMTDSLHPSFLGGFETDSQVSDMFIQGSTAYIATAGQGQFMVIDIHDPKNMFASSQSSPSGWSRQEGNAVSVFENNITGGRTSGGFNITQDHELFSWNASSTGLQPGIFSNTPQSLDIPGGVYGLVTDRTHIFVVSRTIGHELQIFPADYISTSTAQYYSLPALPESMTCDGHSLYVLAHQAPIIYRVDFK
jgi:hypothetical protein